MVIKMTTLKMINKFAVFDALVENTNTSLKVIIKDVKLEELEETGIWLTGKIGDKKLYKHITMTTLKLLLVSSQTI